MKEKIRQFREAWGNFVHRLVFRVFHDPVIRDTRVDDVGAPVRRHVPADAIIASELAFGLWQGTVIGLMALHATIAVVGCFFSWSGSPMRSVARNATEFSLALLETGAEPHLLDL